MQDIYIEKNMESMPLVVDSTRMTEEDIHTNF